MRHKSWTQNPSQFLLEHFGGIVVVVGLDLHLFLKQIPSQFFLLHENVGALKKLASWSGGPSSEESNVDFATPEFAKAPIIITQVIIVLIYIAL